MPVYSPFNIISSVCEMINKNRHDTQYILIISKKMKKEIKDELFARMSDITFVEFHYQNYTKTQYIERLESMEKADGLTPDKSFYEQIGDQKSYTFHEMCLIYQKWVSQRLKTKIYPQYDQYKTAAAILLKKTNDEHSAYAELQNMIGLETVKKTVDRIINYFKLIELYKSKDEHFERPAMNMVFTGNPGTAKTTVARLLAKILKDNKILESGQFVEVGRSDLVGMYVGWTAKIVKEKFEEARGGILFIDEAYSLLDDTKGLYGDEAINTIVQEMENRRDNTIVIFAGYTEPMDDFLKRNPGLRSRVNFKIDFEDYSSADLLKILQLMAKTKHLHIDKEAESFIIDIFEDARKNSDFGNGRFARNLIEQALMNHSDRLAALSEDISDSTLFRLGKEDFCGIYTPEKNDDKKIGFC